MSSSILSASLVQTLPFLADVPYSIMEMPEGTPVFTEGEGCGRIGFLESGVVRVFKLAESGREITLYRINAGESCILSMSCALSNPIHQASAVVESAARVLVVGVRDFQTLMERSHAARDYVFGQFALRLTAVMLLVEEIIFHKVDMRLARILLDHAAEHGSAPLRRTHEELAVELGTAREVISRILKEFERAGAVQLSRGMLIVLKPRLLQTEGAKA